MDINLILTTNRFWDSVTEHCGSSVNISTDLDKNSFMSGPGKWTLGVDNINDPDRCVKRISSNTYYGSTMGEYTEYIVGSGLDDYYCISESVFESGNDNTTMASLPTATNDKLIRYGDLSNRVNYTIFAPTFSESFTLVRVGTAVYSGYVTVTMYLYSSQYDTEAQFYYSSFKYSSAGTANHTQKVLLIAEDNGLDVVDSVKLYVNVSHTSAYTIPSLIYNGTIGTNVTLGRTYSGKTSSTFAMTKAISTADDIKSLFNSTISNGFTIPMVSANTGTALTQKYVADLNSQWMTGSTNPNSSTYYSFQSGKNKGVDKSIDLMYIRLSGYSSFNFYIRSNGESNYDYVVVSKLNTSINSATTYNNSSVYAHTYSASTTGTSLSNYKYVNFTGLSTTSAYTIQVGYRKDTSTSQSADTGYILIPKTNGSYINVYTGSAGNTKSRLSWEEFYLTNANGNRIFLDSYSMKTNTNSFNFYNKDMTLVKSAVRFTSGASGDDYFIEVAGSAFGGYQGSGYVVLQFKNTQYSGTYGDMLVAFPVDINANGKMSSDYGECYIFRENVSFSFTYQMGSVNRNTTLLIYPPSVIGLPSNYKTISNGVSDGFNHYFSTVFVRATSYSSLDYQMSGATTYNYVFCPDDTPNLSLIPSDCTNLTNIFYWHHYYIRNKTNLLYVIKAI